MRGKDTEGSKLYKQMIEDGGTTGGMSLSTRKQLDMDYEKIQKINRSKPRKAARGIVEYVDKWNTLFEDSTRLTIYKTSLELGASRQRAAVLAKEASINFNKMGTGGPLVNALYMFSNASIQGSVKMLRAMKNPKVAASVTTAMVGSITATNEWNDFMDPEWRDKVSKWDRTANLTVVMPKPGFLEGDEKDFWYLNILIFTGFTSLEIALKFF